MEFISTFFSFPNSLGKLFRQFYFAIQLIRTYSAFMDPTTEHQFDIIIIGSGFGGSVSALRLAEKGYRIALLETGRSLRPQDFPKTNWNIWKFLWAPLIRAFGLQKITFLKGLMILHGRGVGGGSLVYAATLMKPHADVFKSKEWPGQLDWDKELSSHYVTAKRMLGVTLNPHLEEADFQLRQLAHSMKVGETFHPTEVGIYFAQEEGQINSDPYFSGAGPERRGCTFCGGCMVGCRVGAKNSLDQNYLFLAKKLGVTIFPETSATRIIPSSGGYKIETLRSTSWLKKDGPVFSSKKVVIAGGVLGSVELLLKNRDLYKTLPLLSRQLGEGIRTNGESLLGATSFRTGYNFSKGIAIGSAFHPDSQTKIEAVRYSEGSGAMRFLAVPLTENGSALSRPLKLLKNILLRFPQLIRLAFVRDWAKSSIILLVMQSIEAKIPLRLGRSRLNPFQFKLRRAAESEPLPSFLPVAQSSGKMLAEQIQGTAQNVISEVLLGAPATAHILGGCTMGKTRDSGVVDLNHQVFGYPNLYVCDGSVVPANLGVNPSLTITAMAERFCQNFPGKNQDTI